jgi:hypothetical protein
VATVTCRITPKLELTRVDALTTGASSTLSVLLPAATSGIATISAAPVTLTCTVAWNRTWTLAISTPESLNLQSLSSSGVGDTNFTTAGCKIIDVRNNEAIGSGKNLIVGGEGSANEFTSPIGTAGDKVTIYPQCAHQFYTRETAGWTVGTPRLFRLDPGANAVSVTVTIAG